MSYLLTEALREKNAELRKECDKLERENAELRKDNERLMYWLTVLDLDIKKALTGLPLMWEVSMLPEFESNTEQQ
jgi:hypothetical protein